MALYGDDSLVNAVLSGDGSVEVPARLATTLEFLRKLTLTPWDLTPEDLEPMRQAGVSDDAIEEAIAVCACFSIIIRLADALDFTVGDDRHLAAIAQILPRLGYRTAVIPGGG